jgi:hypothetical protein
VAPRGAAAAPAPRFEVAASPARDARVAPSPPRAASPTRHATPAPAFAGALDAPPRFAASLPQAIETELGGLFYLLNLATFLGLYGDFTTPQEPGIALSPWDFVTLLGQALIGRPRPRDPVWSLLAGLAGRPPGVRPGAGFRAPAVWRVPGAWLKPFAHEGTWRWSASGGTLRIIHPRGFPVTAVPRSEVSERVQLAHELRRLPRVLGPSAFAAHRAALPPEPRRPLSRWVTRLAAYADARLRVALGLGDEDRVAQALFRCRARVLSTHTHLDVVLRLSELPLAVRFAGLDRTPGWMPAAGQFVTFEFE